MGCYEIFIYLWHAYWNIALITCQFSIIPHRTV